MMAKDLWLYQWMDSYLVRSPQRAASLLTKAEPLEALREIAYEASQAENSTAGTTGIAANTIIAGGDLDFSSRACRSWSCRKKQVDRLFSHVWHYFDRIIVVGPRPSNFIYDWDIYDREELVDELLEDIRLLLYLRNIGADDLLVFTNKPGRCTRHWRKHAREVGLGSALPEASKLIERLADEVEIEAMPCEGHDTPVPHNTHYTIIHPLLPTVFTSYGPRGRASSPSGRLKIAEDVVSLLSAGLVSDIRASRQLDASLGSRFFFDREMLRAAKRKGTEADVAFRLRLPVLDGIEPELLLRVRQDEQDAFESFRTKLRLAAKERLERSEDPDAEKIALELRSDIINPALNDIERRLKAATKLMQHKAGLNIGLGSLITTCGLLAANPVITGAGVAAMVGLNITAANKYLDEQRDIALSDMYFLWRAKQHATDGW
jgi:hypothetical protein